MYSNVVTAIDKILRSYYVSTDEMLDVIEVFMANHTFAAVYATLQTSRARMSLVQRHLAKLRGGSM